MKKQQPIVIIDFKGEVSDFTAARLAAERSERKFVWWENNAEEQSDGHK